MAQPLKEMVDSTVVEQLADRFAAIAKGFDRTRFTSDVVAQLPDLELKQRIEAIARGLAAYLDRDYCTALESVVAVAVSEPPLDGFAAWPLCTFVEIFGIDHPAASLHAMEHLTKRASCEFAIRPFLRDHFEEAYAALVGFTDNDDEAVRRLSSEGSRPRLPWGMRVAQLLNDPEPGLALLERLRHDPSETVRRSLANHLNDVAKDHPTIVVKTAKRWLEEDPPVDHKLATHALRNLVKDGDPAALETLGFTTKPLVEVVRFSVSPQMIEMGDRVELDVELLSTSHAAQRLVIDFVIHHVGAKGGTSPKVFKWGIVDLAAGASATLKKRRLIQQASTRTYRAGIHAVDLQVAGQILASTSFVVGV